MKALGLGDILALPLWVFLTLVILSVVGVLSIIEHIALAVLWASHKARSTMRMILEIDRRRRKGDIKDEITIDPD